MRRGWKVAPVALLLTAVLELAVFTLAGRTVGFGWALVALFAASVAGLLLLRREGMRAWRGFRAAVESGQPPGRQVTDGLVGLTGALLLAVPGLVTGLLGLLVLLPPVRRLVRAGVRRSAQRRMPSMVAGDLFGPRRVRVRRGAPQPTPHPEPVAEPSGAIEGEVLPPSRP